MLERGIRVTIDECIEKLMKIDSLGASTVDDNGCPQTRIISARIFDGTTMYFLTARGKAFAHQLNKNHNIAIIGFDEPNNDFVRIMGKAEKVSESEELKWRDKIYETYPYLENVYPDDTKNINVIYRIKDYTMEYFTLMTHPITREYYEIGNAKLKRNGYIITDNCIGCGTCVKVCPQKVIEEGSPFKIEQEHCLHCGNCYENCPVNAIEEIED